MTKYTTENEAIEGKKILCVFEQRPTYGIDKNTKRQSVAITGNPATALVHQVWQYKKTK